MAPASDANSVLVHSTTHGPTPRIAIAKCSQPKRPSTPSLAQTNNGVSLLRAENDRRKIDCRHEETRQSRWYYLAETWLSTSSLSSIEFTVSPVSVSAFQSSQSYPEMSIGNLVSEFQAAWLSAWQRYAALREPALAPENLFTYEGPSKVVQRIRDGLLDFVRGMSWLWTSSQVLAPNWRTELVQATRYYVALLNSADDLESLAEGLVSLPESYATLLSDLGVVIVGPFDANFSPEPEIHLEGLLSDDWSGFKTIVPPTLAGGAGRRHLFATVDLLAGSEGPWLTSLLAA